VLYRGGPTEREPTRPAIFAAGDRVRARDIHPPTHTRLPRYVRGHVGHIERVIGYHVFPDSNSRGAGEDPQWLYTVTFAGADLWPDAPDPGLTISIDAWEPYLERA
jgi:nitrile hydratase subunit beta